MANWTATRKVSGWIAICSLGYTALDLALMGLPGICGPTGGLLGSWGNSTFGESIWLFGFLTILIVPVALVVWLVAFGFSRRSAN